MRVDVEEKCEYCCWVENSKVNNVNLTLLIMIDDRLISKFHISTNVYSILCSISFILYFVILLVK